MVYTKQTKSIVLSLLWFFTYLLAAIYLLNKSISISVIFDSDSFPIFLIIMPLIIKLLEGQKSILVKKASSNENN